jgi:hypothetical protein
MKKIIFLFVVLILLSSCSNEEVCDSMSLSEAKELAMNCGYELKDTYMCNEGTNTWWIDIEVEDKPLCNPACVINTETKDASINWRCTGLIS